VSAFANLPISRKLMAAFAAVVAVILASSTIVYDRLRVIELAKNSRVHTTDILETLQQAMDALVGQETGVRGYDRRRREIFGALS
jgi:CHASE3 domain sensor protein